MTKAKRLLISSLLLGILISPKAFAYQGGSLKNHAHTTGAGDGGALSLTTQLGSSNLSSFLTYRRPNLVFSSTTAITVETGLDGTAGDVRILFPDNTFLTVNNSTYTTVFATATAVLTISGARGGLFSSTATASNQWYEVMAVKLTDSTTAYVLVGSTLDVTTSNYALLNTRYQLNGWVPLGKIRWGDQASAPSGWVAFSQSGAVTVFRNSCNSGPLNGPGLRLATGSAVSTLAWNYASGMSGAVVPASITNALVGFDTNAPAGQAMRLEEDPAFSGNFRVITVNGATVSQIYTGIPAVLTNGLGLSTSASTFTGDILLTGFIDNSLGVGAGPQF